MSNAGTPLIYSWLTHAWTSDELAWQDSALCRQFYPDLDLWFPEQHAGPHAIKRAKELCGECPVRNQCLDYALTNDERFGVWGGLTEKERHDLRRKRRAAA